MCFGGEADLELSSDRVWKIFVTLRSWVNASALRPLFADPIKRAGLKTKAVWELETGNSLSGEEVYTASLGRSDLYRAVSRLFEQFDVQILPTARVFPFDAKLHWPQHINGAQMSSYHRWMEIVALPTLCGCPTAAVPAGFSSQGLPMGIQVIGRPGDDLGVLEIANAYERATDRTRMSPPPSISVNT